MPSWMIRSRGSINLHPGQVPAVGPAARARGLEPGVEASLADPVGWLQLWRSQHVEVQVWVCCEGKPCGNPHLRHLDVSLTETLLSSLCTAQFSSLEYKNGDERTSVFVTHCLLKLKINSIDIFHHIHNNIYARESEHSRKCTVGGCWWSHVVSWLEIS